MIKRMILMLIAVALVLGGIFGFQVFKANIIKKVMASFANPPQTVSTVKAGYQEWQPTLSAVGSLRAVNGADLSLQQPGIVSEIDFKSGDDVQASQVLLRLRADDDVAKLQALQAVAQLAQIVLARDQKQFAAQAVSQATIDSDNATLKNDLAQVAQQQALLDQKILRAPFAGHIGIRSVDLGQYLAAGTAVVTLQALDPIYVDYFMPQQALDRIRVGQSVTVRIDTYPNESFSGRISAINPLVDVNSRNVQIRATLANADHRLLPGMFATLDVDIGGKQRQITLPQTAIAYNSYGDTVYIVVDKGQGAEGQPQLVAQQSFVTTGATRGDQVAVLKGVKEGDQIVTSGQIKLHNGAPVVINNSVQPTDDPNPKPVEP
jgi:membrane fusion protein (multidrug efflux system)